MALTGNCSVGAELQHWVLALLFSVGIAAYPQKSLSMMEASTASLCPSSSTSHIICQTQRLPHEEPVNEGGINRLPLPIIQHISKQMSNSDIEAARLSCHAWRNAFGNAAVTDVYLAMCADFQRAENLITRFSGAFPGFYHLHFWLPGGAVQQIMGTTRRHFAAYMNMFAKFEIRALTCHYLDDRMCPLVDIVKLSTFTTSKVRPPVPAMISQLTSNNGGPQDSFTSAVATVSCVAVSLASAVLKMGPAEQKWNFFFGPSEGGPWEPLNMALGGYAGPSGHAGQANWSREALEASAGPSGRASQADWSREALEASAGPSGHASQADWSREALEASAGPSGHASQANWSREALEASAGPSGHASQADWSQEALEASAGPSGHSSQANWSREATPQASTSQVAGCHLDSGIAALDAELALVDAELAAVDAELGRVETERRSSSCSKESSSEPSSFSSSTVLAGVGCALDIVKTEGHGSITIKAISSEPSSFSSSSVLGGIGTALHVVQTEGHGSITSKAISSEPISFSSSSVLGGIGSALRVVQTEGHGSITSKAISSEPSSFSSSTLLAGASCGTVKTEGHGSSCGKAISSEPSSFSSSGSTVLAVVGSALGIVKTEGHGRSCSKAISSEPSSCSSSDSAVLAVVGSALGIVKTEGHGRSCSKAISSEPSSFSSSSSIAVHAGVSSALDIVKTEGHSSSCSKASSSEPSSFSSSTVLAGVSSALGIVKTEGHGRSCSKASSEPSSFSSSSSSTVHPGVGSVVRMVKTEGHGSSCSKAISSEPNSSSYTSHVISQHRQQAGLLKQISVGLLSSSTGSSTSVHAGIGSNLHVVQPEGPGSSASRTSSPDLSGISRSSTAQASTGGTTSPVEAQVAGQLQERTGGTTSPVEAQRQGGAEAQAARLDAVQALGGVAEALAPSQSPALQGGLDLPPPSPPPPSLLPGLASGGQGPPNLGPGGQGPPNLVTMAPGGEFGLPPPPPLLALQDMAPGGEDAPQNVAALAPWGEGGLPPPPLAPLQQAGAPGAEGDLPQQNLLLWQPTLSLLGSHMGQLLSSVLGQELGQHELGQVGLQLGCELGKLLGAALAQALAECSANPEAEVQLAGAPPAGLPKPADIAQMLSARSMVDSLPRVASVIAGALLAAAHSTPTMGATEYIITSISSCWGSLQGLRVLHFRNAPASLASQFQALFQHLPSLVELKVSGPEDHRMGKDPFEGSSAQPSFSVGLERDPKTLELGDVNLSLSLQCKRKSDVETAASELRHLCCNPLPHSHASRTPQYESGTNQALQDQLQLLHSLKGRPCKLKLLRLSASRPAHLMSLYQLHNAKDFEDSSDDEQESDVVDDHYMVDADSDDSHTSGASGGEAEPQPAAGPSHLASSELSTSNVDWHNCLAQPARAGVYDLSEVSPSFANWVSGQAGTLDPLPDPTLLPVPRQSSPLRGASASPEEGLAQGSAPSAAPGGSQDSTSEESTSSSIPEPASTPATAALAVPTSCAASSGASCSAVGGLSRYHILRPLHRFTQLTSLSIREEISPHAAEEEGASISRFNSLILTELASAIAAHCLPNLTHLEWHGKMLAPHPSSFKHLSGLTALQSLSLGINIDDPLSLTVTRPPLRYLPHSLHGDCPAGATPSSSQPEPGPLLPRLCHLHLQNCALADLSTFACAPNLQWLSLENCDVSIHTSDIPRLWPNLSWLEITYVHLMQDWTLVHDSPDDLLAFTQLSRLRKLSLVTPYDQLTQIEDLLALTQVRLLCLSPCHDIGYAELLQLSELGYLAGLEIKLYSDVHHHEHLIDMASTIHAAMQEGLPMTDVLVMVDDEYVDATEEEAVLP
eukprot:gene32176-16714_t